MTPPPWRVASLLCGVILSAYLSRVFFFGPPDLIPETHEGAGYLYRLIDFREALASGTLFPQWSTYMRGGLGEPYFSYYQPGFFYLASLLPNSLLPLRALGVAVFIASLTGFVGMSRLVGTRVGPGPGLLASIILLLSVYPATEIYIRGDLAEYTAMMMLPFLVHCLLVWDDQRTRRHFVGAALCAAGIIVTHASVALLSYLALGGVAALAMARTHGVHRLLVSALPLLAGGFLSAFYWFPVFFEWHLVQPESAFTGFYDFHSHFVSLASLGGPSRRTDSVVPVSLGRPILVLVLLNLVVAMQRWKRSPREQRTLLVVCGVMAAEAIFMMTRWSLLLWEGLPLLYRVQFPWRLLSLATVTVAVLAALWVPRARAVGIVWIIAVCLLLLLSTSHTTADRVGRVALPARPSDMVALGYWVDAENEWVPRGAPILPAGASLGVWTSSPRCRTEGFARTQSRLQLAVDTEEDCLVVLPHYYFPVGWRAETGGRPLRLSNQGGFMGLHLGAGTSGDVIVRFTATPMKRWGIVVSLLSLLGGLAGLAWTGGRAGSDGGRP